MDLKKLCKTKFLTEQGEKNLIAYKYVGSDASLLYKHFFSPVAQFLVDKVIPIWLAYSFTLKTFVDICLDQTW